MLFHVADNESVFSPLKNKHFEGKNLNNEDERNSEKVFFVIASTLGLRWRMQG